MNSKYYIGLDCGTSSVGWAVTDDKYTLVKKAGKTLWGVRLFDEATAADKRRMARSARRRTGRKAQRLALLREIFSGEISKNDPLFYTRLDESKFWQEDKYTKTKYALFASDEFTDWDYYDQFPTIYHLRNALAKGNTSVDIRLLFLGINHILKHRGHFLYSGLEIAEGDSANGTPDFSEIWMLTQTSVADVLDISFDCSNPSQLKKVLSEKASVTSKKHALKSIFSCEEPKEKILLDLLAGSKVDIAKLFPQEDTQDPLPKVSFADATFENEETCEILERACGDGYAMILQLKALYDYGMLDNILKGHNFYSESKVAAYEKHKKDLDLLKAVIKKYVPKEYAKLFRSVSQNSSNYSAYVGYCKVAGKKNRDVKLCNPADFFKTLKKILEKIDCDAAREIIQEIDAGTFLPKQTTKENSVVPNQVQLHELQAILDNNMDKFPFLAAKDNDGFTNAYKIKSLLTFRIPYYVGPLNDAHKDKGFCWVVKKQPSSVLPWNFDTVIDKEASAEKFIENLTATCTYLTGESVLPKHSILYSRFMVLNELNNLKIHGEPISVSLKQQLFDTLFLQKKKVTGKALQQWLVQNGMLQKDEKDAISGIDGDFSSSRGIEIDMHATFAENMPDIETLEKCILAILCLANEPAMLKKRLAKLVPTATDKQLRSMASLRLAGWGRLSAKLLDGDTIVAATTDTGEAMTILQALYHTNNNLEQLLSSAFQYKAAIEGYNDAITADETVTYDTVAALYTSPAVKRPIWQAYTLVKEIEKIMGGAPDKIFIEMARGASANEKGKRKISRKASLIHLYESVQKEKDAWWATAAANKTRDWKNELEEREDGRYRSDKLYLYYTQMGRCMYTGQPIDLDELLSNDKLYDIDHIWPQARLKDDSLENRVLVTRTANADKGDTYPIKPEIQKKQITFWKALYDKGFIGKKKWERLTRSAEFTPDELAGFINRQLVETRQSTKELAKILETAFKSTKIVHVKAGNVADFRQLYDIVKLRDLNDLHHAKDAYLNVVVGNVYHVRFTSNPLHFIKEEQKKAKLEYSLKPKTIFGHDVKRGHTLAWQAGEDGTLATVLKQVYKNNALLTYQCIERNSGQNGGFHDQNPVKGKEGLIPLKTSEPRFLNTERYGGYSGDTGAYGFLVEHTENKKRVRSIEFMMVSQKAQYEQMENGLETYCTQELQLVEPRILLNKIRYNSVLKVDGFPICITARTGAYLTGKMMPQLILSPKEEKLLKAACKIAARVKEERNSEFTIRKQYDGIGPEDTLLLYDTLLAKAQAKIYANRSLQVVTLQQGKSKFITLSLAEQCTSLYNILQLFKGRGVANLELIGGKSAAGKIYIPSNLSKSKYSRLVTSSVTGFFTSEIDLQRL